MNTLRTLRKSCLTLRHHTNNANNFLAWSKEVPRHEPEVLNGLAKGWLKQPEMREELLVVWPASDDDTAHLAELRVKRHGIKTRRALPPTNKSGTNNGLAMIGQQVEGTKK